MTRRRPRRSESPFSRLGSRTEEDVRRATYQLHGAETLFGVAHQVVGEWRAWRSVAEASGVSDPFDLGRRSFGAAELQDALLATVESDDDRLLGLTGDAVGAYFVDVVATSTTTVDGTLANVWTFALAREEAGPFGVAVDVNDVEILSPAGTDEGGIGITAWTAASRDALLIRADQAFVDWLAAGAGWIVVERGDERDTLTVPTLTLPPGRGEI